MICKSQWIEQSETETAFEQTILNKDKNKQTQLVYW